MMSMALIAVFLATYAAITLEHPLGVNKSASALVGAGLLWLLLAVWSPGRAGLAGQLGESAAATAQIVFFLVGAMAAVEVVDAHDGFAVVTRWIRSASLSSLLWVIGLATFLLSPVLDNLTTTIVMISLSRKLLARHQDRLVFAGIVVIAANAGGAWSPIGDVTTTMLWIGGQVTAPAIAAGLFLPSAVCLLVPLAVTAHRLRGRELEPVPSGPAEAGLRTSRFERNLMFALGLGILLAVPLFKSLTHLPPFLGMLTGLGLLWLVGDLVHRRKPNALRQHLGLARALSRIDMSSVVFFIGILLAVAALEHGGILAALARWLELTVGRLDVIVLMIGLASAVVDNVPLVAAAMGMYSLTQYPADHFLWEFLAYCAGTGGSILVIGSAAGVAAMGLERIGFFWYLRRMGGLALLGYVAGAAVYIVQYRLFS